MRKKTKILVPEVMLRDHSVYPSYEDSISIFLIPEIHLHSQLYKNIVF